MDKSGLLIVKETFYLNDVISIVGNYGWFLLGFSILARYVYLKMKPTMDEYFAKRKQREHSANYYKNSDLIYNRSVARQKRILQLQEQYEQQAEEYKRKMQEKEDIKRQNLLKSGPGRRFNSPLKWRMT